MKAVITGGAGYVGHRLGQALADAGHAVLLLDLAAPPGDSDGRLAFASVDVRDEQALAASFQGAGVVFHLASYGMSGSQQLQRGVVEAVNVGGTRAVIAAALSAGVPSLVYLSTYNVVFGGQRIEGGDECLPYFPPHRHPDAYSRTKALAEQLVLAANMTPLPGRPGQFLRTCALRPAGIYGPGEQRHLPRIVRYLEAGLFCFVIGPPHEGIVDWVHVDNLVAANLLAARALTAEKDYRAAGQAYFIHDGWPGVTSRVNNFEFLRPLIQGLGYSYPRLALPRRLVYCLAWLLEWAHALLLPLLDISRVFILTRAEVHKSSGTHWFSIEKARRELGYRPRRYPFQPVVDWFLERGHGRMQGRQLANGEGRSRQQQQRGQQSSTQARRRQRLAGPAWEQLRILLAAVFVALAALLVQLAAGAAGTRLLVLAAGGG